MIHYRSLFDELVQAQRLATKKWRRAENIRQWATIKT